MYISCYNLHKLGLTKGGCCGTCHDEDELDPYRYGLIEIYGSDLGFEGPEERDKVYGHVCCAVSHKINGNKDILLKCFHAEYDE